MEFKIAIGEDEIGTITEDAFRRFQVKHGMILYSNIEQAQFVECEGNYYRDEWLRPLAGEVECVDAEITRMEEVVDYGPRETANEMEV